MGLPFRNWLIGTKSGFCPGPAPLPSSRARIHLLFILGLGSQNSQPEPPEVVAQPPRPSFSLAECGKQPLLLLCLPPAPQLAPPPGLSHAWLCPHPLSLLRPWPSPSPQMLLLDPLFLPPDLREQRPRKGGEVIPPTTPTDHPLYISHHIPPHLLLSSTQLGVSQGP